MLKSRWRLVVLTVMFGLGVNLSAAEPSAVPGEKVRFERTRLDANFRSEGVAVADFNNDGKQDIAAGFVWYEAPDWKMHVIANDPPPGTRGALVGNPPHYDPKGYSNSFCNFADDLNGDGWADLLVVDFPGTPTWWFQNPGKSGGEWTRHVVTPVTNNESPTYLDIDGDGQRELVAAFSPDPKQSDGPERKMAFMTRQSDPNAEWKIRAVSTAAAPGTMKYSHGLGVGDVNKDGRNDIVCGEGWWESPADSSAETWQFHAAPFGNLAAQMFVFDFDGDGDNDVLSSSPHAYGIWWHEQLADGAWKSHEIEKSFSQTHGVCFADMNNDGLPDFVTGKRWWAHGGRDPGGNDPAVFFWFELKRENGRPVWIPHQFDHDSGPGTQFEVADVNGDGLLDVISSNKKGVHYFQQVRE